MSRAGLAARFNKIREKPCGRRSARRLASSMTVVVRMNVETDETSELLRRAARGDRAGMEDVLARHRDRLLRMVALRLDHRLRKRIDPSDVIQEAYLEASARLETYLRAPSMPFFLWLRFLVVQKIVTLHRHHLGAGMRDAYSPDGRAVVTGCEDGMARIWDVRTGELRVPPLPHQAWVFAVAFSPDGKMVLTGSRDRSARLWDASTGQPIGPPLLHPNDLWSVAFTPDGRSILTGDIGETARVYAMSPEWPDDPEQVSDAIEVLTGLRLDPVLGAIQVLDNAAWRAARDRSRRTDRSSTSDGDDRPKVEAVPDDRPGTHG